MPWSYLEQQTGPDCKHQVPGYLRFWPPTSVGCTFVQTLFSWQYKKHKYITYRNLKCLNHEKFVNTLDETPWDAIFVFNELDNIVSGCYSLPYEAIDANAPLKKTYPRRYKT